MMIKMMMIPDARHEAMDGSLLGLGTNVSADTRLTSGE